MSTTVATDRLRDSHRPRVFFQATVALWLLLQIAVVVVIGNRPGVSDAFRYETLARESIDAGSWYPLPDHISGENLNPNYICYPGLVNLIALCLRVFGTIQSVYWLNIVFNCIICWSLWRIGTDVVNHRFGCVAAFIYCLTPYSALSVAESMSELPFMATALLAVALIGRRNTAWLAVAGLLLALSQYIRTTALIYAGGTLLYLIFYRFSFSRLCSFVGGLALGLAAVVAVNCHLSGGYRFLSSTTLGVNMIQGASDETNGEYCEAAFNKPEIEAELSGRNVFEIDSILQSESKTWITANPGRWLTYIPAKSYYYFAVDAHLLYGRHTPLTQSGFWLKVRHAYPHLFQWCLYLSALTGLWLRRRHLIGVDGIILLVYLANLGLAWLTVGSPRYHFPVLPCLFYFSAFAVTRALQAFYFSLTKKTI